MAATAKSIDVGRKPRLYYGEEVLDLPEPEWILPGFVQKGGLTVVYGEPGSGKSLLMQDWANVIQYGWKWMGRETVRANVLYIMAEGQYGLRGRLLAWKLHRNAERLPPVAYSLENVSLWRPAGNAEHTADQKGLVAVVEDEHIDVVFVDTLAATFGGGNENSQQDMNMYLDTLRRFQERGASVIVSHHTNKESKSLRGSTVLSGAADTMIRLDSKRNIDNPALIESTVLYCDKQKDYVPFSPFRLKVESVTLGERDDGSEITSVVYVPPSAEDELLSTKRERKDTLMRTQILTLLESNPQGLEWTAELFKALDGNNAEKGPARDALEMEGRIYKKDGRWYFTTPDEVETL